MDKDGFLRALLSGWVDGYWTDINGGDLHELLLKYNFGVERAATQEDMESGYWEEWDIELGDTITEWTDEMKELLR